MEILPVFHSMYSSFLFNCQKCHFPYFLLLFGCNELLYLIAYCIINESETGQTTLPLTRTTH